MNIHLLDHQCAHKFHMTALYHSFEEAFMLLCNDPSSTQALSAHIGAMSNRPRFAGPTPAAIPHGTVA